MPDPDIDLTDLDAQYAKATAPERGEYETVPDGTYQVAVAGAEVRTSEAGNRMLSWDLRVLAGAHKDRHVFRQNMMQTEQNLDYLKADLGIAGVTLAKLSDLPARCGELLNVCLEIRVRTKGEFTNVYIQKRLGGQAAPAPAASAPAAAQPANAPAQPAPSQKKDRF